MVDNEMEKVVCRCMWYDQCARFSEECLGTECDDYFSGNEFEISDAELDQYKYEFRDEFFEFAEENDLYDEWTY